MRLAELQMRPGDLGFRPDQIGKLNPQKPGGRLDGPQAAFESFGDVLTRKISDESGIRFSAHAAKRMQERNILPTEDELTRLQSGFERVKAKGADSSLILVDQNAYVVSVKNQTVITALDRDMAQGNVFSNIDSVAIV